jgi:PDZ domain-containing protein
MKRYEINYRTVFITVLLTVATMSVLLYAPSPFVVTKPGIAVPTDHYITLVHDSLELDEHDEQSASTTEGDEGQLLLTAVLLETPNIWNSLGAIFVPSQEVRLKRDVLGRASIEEYIATVTTMMQDSHHNAIEAAYRNLGIAYTIQSQQVTAQQVDYGILTASKLKAGDRIIAGVDQHGQQLSIQSIAQLAAWLKEQATEAHIAGVSLVIERDKEQLLIPIDDVIDVKLSDEEMVAQTLGISSFIELRVVTPEDERYKLNIATDNIGGPSAGLVFALSIIDKLTQGDLTNGKQLAATGTIDALGNVGTIGGIVQKVYTTGNRGVDLFLVPKGNEKEAKRALKSIDSEMQIAGVSSLEEAIEIIASLQQLN